MNALWRAIRVYTILSRAGSDLTYKPIDQTGNNNPRVKVCHLPMSSGLAYEAVESPRVTN